MYDDKMEMDPTVIRLKNKLLPTFPELRNVKLMKGSESATINKYRVYLCTDYDGKSYDDNMLTYVLLHELAHVLTPEIGHGTTFRTTFEQLLTRAKQANLYDPKAIKPSNYCGMDEKA
jgi:predicted metal-dependent hydrolase